MVVTTDEDDADVDDEEGGRLANIGLAVSEGGNCTVGSEGTGNIIVPATGAELTVAAAPPPPLAIVKLILAFFMPPPALFV